MYRLYLIVGIIIVSCLLGSIKREINNDQGLLRFLSGEKHHLNNRDEVAIRGYFENIQDRL